MNDALLCTKLRPPFLRPRQVRRPRLQAQIHAGFGRPLTLVTAPAGYGKTTLVATALAAQNGAAAWLTLDAEDNQPRRFLQYLVAAIQIANEQVGHELLAILASTPDPSPKAILTALVNQIAALDSEITLVFDDYHVIRNQAIHDALNFLLRHLPPSLHVVLVTRADAPLLLGRWRARDAIVELRTADLTFTADEAAEFLNQAMDLALDDVSVRTLVARTEGWISGLQLAALALRSAPDPAQFVQAFSGTNRFVLDYLLEEVLANESSTVQTFLLQTSILTRLSGPLCHAVTGGTQAPEMLQQLEARNLFVQPLDTTRRWYRYHPLFADLLQARLRHLHATEVQELYRRACAWCATNEQVAEAIEYALKGQAFDTAAHLIGLHWREAAGQGEIDRAWDWLQALPADMVRQCAALSAASAWLCWLRGDMQSMGQHLHAAAQTPAASVDSQAGTLPAELTALDALVARYGAKPTHALRLTDRAQALMPPHLPPDAAARLRALIALAEGSAADGAGDLERAIAGYAESIDWAMQCNDVAGIAGITYRLTNILQLRGRLHDAKEACRTAFAHLKTHSLNRLPAAGILHLAICEVLIEENSLQEAEAHLHEGRELGKWSGRLTVARNAAHAQMRICLAQQDDAGALAALSAAQAALQTGASALARAELMARRATLACRQGALEEAVRSVAEAVALASWDRGYTGLLVDLADRRVRLTQNPSDAYVRSTHNAVAAMAADGNVGAAVELALVLSLALARRAAWQPAFDALNQALTLAAPAGYMRLFLDEGYPAANLLARWANQAAAGPTREYATRLLHAFPPDHVRQSAPQRAASGGEHLLEPLSRRELEVLELLAEGMTNREIAATLIIAPGTVKAHTAAIYRKLDVANRTAAVARGRALRLLG